MVGGTENLVSPPCSLGRKSPAPPLHCGQTGQLELSGPSRLPDTAHNWKSNWQASSCSQWGLSTSVHPDGAGVHLCREPVAAAQTRGSGGQMWQGPLSLTAPTNPGGSKRLHSPPASPWLMAVALQSLLTQQVPKPSRPFLPPSVCLHAPQALAGVGGAFRGRAE